METPVPFPKRVPLSPCVENLGRLNPLPLRAHYTPEVCGQEEENRPSQGGAVVASPGSEFQPSSAHGGRPAFGSLSPLPVTGDRNGTYLNEFRTRTWPALAVWLCEPGELLRLVLPGVPRHLHSCFSSGSSGYKMKKRVGAIEEFTFLPLTEGRQLHITIAITGWLASGKYREARGRAEKDAGLAAGLGEWQPLSELDQLWWTRPWPRLLLVYVSRLFGGSILQRSKLRLRDIGDCIPHPSTDPSFCSSTHPFPPIYPYPHPLIHPSTHPPIYPYPESTHSSIHPPTHLPIYPHPHLLIHPSTHPPIHLPSTQQYL